MKSGLDTVFKVSIILKGLDALVEIIGGVLLLFVTPSAINHFVATFLGHSAEHFTADSILLGAIYLLSHGLIKLFIIINVLRDKYWAYPVLIVVLLASSIYQTIDIINHHSIFITLLTIFDLFVIVITWLEWQKKRRTRLKPASKEESQVIN